MKNIPEILDDLIEADIYLTRREAEALTGNCSKTIDKYVKRKGDYEGGKKGRLKKYPLKGLLMLKAKRKGLA